MRVHPTGTSSRRKAAEAAGLDCAAAFQKMALGCVAAIKAHHTSACAGDAEAVHQIRVAITRLRAAVAFFAPIVVDAEWLRLKQEIAWLNGPLGAARDSDVVVEYARRKRYRAWAQAMIGEQLEQRQTQDHRRLVRCLRSARTQRLSRPWRAGSDRERGWSVTSGARTRKLAILLYAGELNRWHDGWSAKRTA
jgi:CHAD domain-containing protein